MEKKARYNRIEVIFEIALGGVFIAVGLGVTIAVSSSVIGADATALYAAAVVPISLFGVLPIAFGLIPFTTACKKIAYSRREKRALQRGTNATAQILGCKTVSYNGTQNKRYALKLTCTVDGKEKFFTTDYLFDVNEYKYLRHRSVAVKVDGNFFAVTEPFPRDIYTVNPMYGIEWDFFTQNKVRATLRILRIAVALTLTVLLSAVVATVVLHKGIYLIVAAIAFVAVNIPFAVLLAVFFLQWVKRKKG